MRLQKINKKIVIKNLYLYLMFPFFCFGIHFSEANDSNSCRDLQGDPKLACLRQNYELRAQQIRDRIGTCDRMISSPGATEAQITRAGACLNGILRQNNENNATSHQPISELRIQNQSLCVSYVLYQSLSQRAGGGAQVRRFSKQDVLAELEVLRRNSREEFDRNTNICLSRLEREPEFRTTLVEISERVTNEIQANDASAAEQLLRERPARRGE